MTDLEGKFLIHAHFNGIYWAYYGLDVPEWTRPEYNHQN
ncbi:hypothetical protein ES703_89605 [subsurface metagenome]